MHFRPCALFANSLRLKSSIRIAIVVLLLLSVILLSHSSVQYSTALVEPSASTFFPESYQLVQHPLPNGSSEPWSVATDSLGRVWIIEQGSNQLAVFDPQTSSFHEYSIPTPNSTADSVMVDTSDNVWFTELTTSKLGELSNGSSTIQEFRIPNSTVSLGNSQTPVSCGPNGAYQGPDGGIWILCLFSNQIDEFVPTNDSFRSFDLPVFQSGPAGLVFDHSGNFWFTAADADMLGHGIASELSSGTSDGIQEFAPINSTYTYNFEHETDFEGKTENITSSLPTPSGIGLSPDGTTLWITEHVDSSFDSYNINSKSLDRYWTSQTFDDFGYTVSFPNGLSVTSSGTVWIAEHYGNKVAEYNPNSDTLTEYVVPCCGENSAGVYTLTSGKNGTVWFVEIFGNALGELEPVQNGSSSPFSVTVGQSLVSLAPSGPSSISIPLQVTQSGGTAVTNVSLELSGVSSTGALSGVSATFSPSSLELSGSQRMSSNLSLTLGSLKPGRYDLMIGARLDPENVICSIVLKLVVSPGTYSVESLFSYGAAIGVAGSVAVIGFLVLRRRRKSVRRKKWSR
jgi:streptogramin lyase